MAVTIGRAAVAQYFAFDDPLLRHGALDTMESARLTRFEGSDVLDVCSHCVPIEIFKLIIFHMVES